MLPVTAPIVAHFTDLGGVPAVDATIDGKGPFHFILDTGAGAILITPECAKQIGILGKGTESVRGSSEGSIDATRATIARVSIGSATASSLAAVIVPLPPDVTYQGRYGTISGIIGSPFLEHFVTTLDYHDDTVAFADPSTFVPPHDATALPLRLIGNIPVVAVKVDGFDANLDIDSGNDCCISLNAQFGAQNDVTAAYAHPIVTSSEGVTGRVGSTLLRLHGATIGTYTLNGAVATLSHAATDATTSNGVDGTIGYDVLRRFTTTIDYAKRTLYLTPDDRLEEYTPVFFAGGFVSQRNADGTLSVIEVIAGTPASAAGVRDGDTLVAVNGESIAQMSRADLSLAFHRQAPEAIELTLSSRGASRTITYTLRDLLP